MRTYIERFRNKCKRIVHSLTHFFGMMNNVNQLIKISVSENSLKNILIIGHGEISIPSNGWGAVETVIFEMCDVLVKNGFGISVLNSKSIFTWLQARRFKPNTILLHDDAQIRKARFFWPRSKILLTTHYGYAAFPKKWTGQYKKSVYKKFHHADKIICLSDAIYNTFLEYYDPKKLLLSANGTNFSPSISGNPPQNKYICVGKIEERKRQFDIYKTLVNHNIQVDFYGPIVDTRVIEKISIDINIRKSFKGPISRIELSRILPTYRALIHLSDAEADALVLYEAQVAGLPIVISPNSVGSQDASLPWIFVVNGMSDLSDALKKIEEFDQIQRVEISDYSRLHYQWAKRMKSLLIYLVNNDE